jgi:hypothetical protein
MRLDPRSTALVANDTHRGHRHPAAAALPLGSEESLAALPVAGG